MQFNHGLASSRPGRVKLLLIEDDPRDARLIREYLLEHDPSMEILHARNLAEARPELGDPSVDAILVDLHLPDSNGLESVAVAHAASVGQPIVAMTGRSTMEIGVQAMRLGAQDFLVKDDLTPCSLGRALRLAIERQRLLACMRDSVQASLEGEENLRRLLLSGTEALVVYLLNGSVAFANLAADELFGWTPADFDKRSFPLQASPGIEQEHEIIRPDGTRVVAEMRTVNVMWRDQPARLASLRDVSERRLATEHQIRLDMLTSFLGNVSHELRTLLAAIYQFVSNVRDGIDGPVNDLQRQSLEVAIRNVDEVLAMIANLLEVARSQAGKLRIENQIVRLGDEISGLVGVLQASAREHGIRFACRVPDDLPHLLADPARVRQIVANLAENAIKFTPRGGVVEVSARHDAASGRVSLVVSDTGCGVPSEHLENIFDQLHQVPETVYRTRRGLGLGLYITRELVRGLGGEIRVRSEPGKCTSFEVLLPVFSWEVVLQPLLGRAIGCDWSAVLIGVHWPQSATCEPIPDGVLRNLEAIVRSVVGDCPHVVIPRAQSNEQSRLGIVLAAPEAATRGFIEKIQHRLQDDSSWNESALEIDVESVALGPAPAQLQPSDAVSILERRHFQTHPHGEPSCPIRS